MTVRPRPHVPVIITFTAGCGAEMGLAMSASPPLPTKAIIGPLLDHAPPPGLQALQDEVVSALDSRDPDRLASALPALYQSCLGAARAEVAHATGVEPEAAQVVPPALKWMPAALIDRPATIPASDPDAPLRWVLTALVGLHAAWAAAPPGNPKQARFFSLAISAIANVPRQVKAHAAALEPLSRLRRLATSVLAGPLSPAELAFQQRGGHCQGPSNGA